MPFLASALLDSLFMRDSSIFLEAASAAEKSSLPVFPSLSTCIAFSDGRTCTACHTFVRWDLCGEAVGNMTGLAKISLRHSCHIYWGKLGQN